MKLIVGLGNPGVEYQFTPHNIGFLAIDRIAERESVKVENRHCRALTARCRIAGEDALLAKPETFMNLSGTAVKELVEEYGVDPARDLIVLYDELDLPLGNIRIRQRGSAAGHKGMISIQGALGTQELTRVRMGIDPERTRGEGREFVLSQWKKKELEVVGEVLDRAAEAVGVIVREGALAAMTKFNRKAESEESE